MLFRNALQWGRAYLALRHVAAELLAALLHITDFGAVVSRAIKWRAIQFVIGNWNTKARAEHAQLFIVELLLLVRNVLAFAGFTQTVSLNSFGQHNGRRALGVDGRLIRRINLDRIVTTQAHARELLV